MVHRRYGLSGGWQKLLSQPEHEFHLLDLRKKDLLIIRWQVQVSVCPDILKKLRYNSACGTTVSSLPGSVFCFLAEFFFLPLGALGAAPSRTLVSATMGASFLTGAGACSALTSGCWSSTEKGQVREEYFQKPVCLETNDRGSSITAIGPKSLNLRIWQLWLTFLTCIFLPIPTVTQEEFIKWKSWQFPCFPRETKWHTHL